MRTLIASLLLVALALGSTVAQGTTWVESKIDDPVSGASVKVTQPASSGSYIYQWPEKSDQVFWPYTDDHWLWFSETSGYIAFGGDFAKLESEKRSTLRQWLKENFDEQAPPKTRLERLRWAERVYEARGMDDAFWCHFFRLMAFETRSDSEESLRYVARALPLLVSRLDDGIDLGEKLETFYLLSEYHRRLGNESESEAYLERLQSTNPGDELAEFKKYLLEIAKAQRGSAR